VRFPPPLIYLAGLLAGIGLHVLLAAGSPPVAVRIAGAVAGVAAFAYFDGRAMGAFRRTHNNPTPWTPTTTLVVDGAYRRTRNPMYVGMAFLYGGFAFALGTLVALVVLPVVLIVIDRYAIAREEHYMERRFGGEYVDYKRRVRRWV
jgi:protein-S-isoprenylcysteine O-methyltransferase Ste14